MGGVKLIPWGMGEKDRHLLDISTRSFAVGVLSHSTPLCSPHKCPLNSPPQHSTPGKAPEHLPFLSSMSLTSNNVLSYALTFSTSSNCSGVLCVPVLPLPSIKASTPSSTDAVSGPHSSVTISHLNFRTMFPDSQSSPISNALPVSHLDL